jgi:hypothetical protein
MLNGPRVRSLATLPLAAIMACGGPALREPTLTPPAGWSPEDSGLPDDAAEALRLSRAELESTGLRRTFWPRALDASVAELESRGLVASDGPCGPTISAWIKSIPLNHPILAAERAIELGSDGTPMAEWPLPVYSEIAGVDGDRLLVPLRFWPDATTPVPAMAISPTGAMSIVAIVPEANSEVFPCPAILSFGDSAYLRCMFLIDRSSRERRRVAYEAPCT